MSTNQDDLLQLDIQLKAKPSPGSIAELTKSILTTDIDYKKFIEDLNRFGFKTPMDFIKFIKSKEGETIISTLNQQLIEENHHHKLKAQEIEQQTMLNRVMAFLVLASTQKDAEAEDFIKNTIIQQQQNKTNFEKKSLETSAGKYVSRTQKELSDVLEDYDKALKSNQQQIVENKNEKNFLDTLMDKLNQQKVNIEEKYSQYEKGLESIEEPLNNFDDLSKEELQDMHKKLTDNMFKMTPEVTNLIINGKENEARKLMQVQTDLGVQAASIHDIISVKEGKKQYFDAKGLPVKSLKESAFILDPKEQKILEHDNQYYLLKPHQNIEKMTESEQKIAREDYQYLKGQLMTVKNVISHNKQLEQEDLSKQVNNTINKLDINKEKQQQLEKQQELIHDAKTSTLQNSYSPDQSKTKQNKTEDHDLTEYDELVEVSKKDETSEMNAEEDRTLKKN